jgi:DNA polymerase-3 subunit alpha
LRRRVARGLPRSSATGCTSNCSAHGLPEEKQIEAALLDLAYTNNLPLAAANEPFYARREDFEAHDALICIAEGRIIAETERRQPVDRALLQVARRNVGTVCRPARSFGVDSRDRAALCIPAEDAQADPAALHAEDGSAMDEAAELRRQAEEGLTRRVETLGLASGLTIDDYRQRLDFELGVIERMKYPGYFLIVADFIQWAKSRGIPVGPGRGSGAGSLVAYALTITDLDPIRFGLLFERFLNPERVSMPDFDIDFCQDRRNEVIDYVQGRYGRDHVGQIITFGTLQARGVLRDVGRVLEMPYGQVDKLCKLVPMNPAAPVTLARAIDEEPRLQAARDAEPVVRRAFDIARKLEGLHRHASTHAAGIVIGDRPLAELVPMYRDPKSDLPVTQFNMKWVEQAGLVKFDFLGLKTLSVLQTAVMLLKRRGVEIDLPRHPARRCKELRDALTRRDGRHLPGGRAGHAPRPDGHATRPLRGHHCAGRALPSGSDGEHPDLLRAQARQGAARIHPPEARAGAARDFRRHSLPRAGDGSRAAALRLLAR